jgi:hypothetical protein
MAEAIARRPGIRSDAQEGFAYLAHLAGDNARSQEIAANTQPSVAVPIFVRLKLVPA